VGFVVNVKGEKSHHIVQQAITVLLNLNHRGACGCESNTGDVAGILLQVPHTFLKSALQKEKISLPGEKEYGVGMVYLPQEAGARRECEKVFEQIVKEEGQTFLGWRSLLTDDSMIGPTAKAGEPFCRQVFVGRSSKLQDDAAFERKLYVIRKRAENQIRYSGKIKDGERFYISSLSYKTIIYKGMLLSEQVKPFYKELTDPSVQTALALVHSRFSTNTFPNWERAHPYRYIAHNGEINTLRGNINWMHARETLLAPRGPVPNSGACRGDCRARLWNRSHEIL
jgi:glutamate synthase (ferredoxin)